MYSPEVVQRKSNKEAYEEIEDLDSDWEETAVVLRKTMSINRMDSSRMEFSA